MNNTPNLNLNEQTAPTDAKKPRYCYRASDIWLAGVMWILGYLYTAAVPIGSSPLPAMLVQLLLFVGVPIYLFRCKGCRITPVVWVLLGVGVALSLSFLWTVNRAMLNAVAAWNAFCWFYAVFVITGNSREQLPSEHFVGELLTAAAVMPYRAPCSIFGALFGQKTMPDGSARPKSRLRATLGWVCLGLALAVVPTAIVVLLLSYDEGFSKMMLDIVESVFRADTIFRFLRDAVLGLFVGAILFGALMAARERSLQKPYTGFFASFFESDEEEDSVPKDGAHRIPVPLVAAMLTPIMAVYVVFFLSQWDYYISAFTGTRPEALTFSAYAREGFFQLLSVAIINALLGIAASLLSVRRAEDPSRPHRARSSPVIRIYLALLSVMTLILIATALAKMLLYVDTYGLTHKRVYATWLMLLLAVCFVAVLVRQIWSRMNLQGTLLWVFLAFLLIIAMAPTDALIVRYNVNLALDGNLYAMQGDVCEDSGAAGVLAALNFMEKTAEGHTAIDAKTLDGIRAHTDDYLFRMASELAELEWHEHNITTLRAEKALKAAGYRAGLDQ